MSTLSDAQKEQLLALLRGKPPKIGLGGVSGTGKSSTINQLCKTSLPISHTRACTTQFRDVPMKVKISQGQMVGEQIQLIVCDAPGLGEDVRRDEEYIRMYETHLPDCDVILWVLSARNRAVALDQQYLERFKHLHHKMVFGLGLVDLVEPMNWKAGSPIPLGEQAKNIADIVLDRQERLSATLGRPVTVIPYSNKHRYNLQELFSAVLEACDEGRKWIFAGLKGFKVEDLIPAELEQELNDRQKSGSKNPPFNPLGWFGNHGNSMSLSLQSLCNYILGRKPSDQSPLNDEEIDALDQFVQQQKQSRQSK